MRSITRVIVETAVIWAFAYFVFRKSNPWIGLFVFMVSIMTVYPGFGKFAILRRDAILFGVGFYALLKYYADRDLIFNGIRTLATVNAIFLLLQWLGVDPFNIMSFGMFVSKSGIPTGIMTNQNEASILIGITLPLFLVGGWRWVLPTILLSLIPAKSTGGIACVLVSANIYIFHQKKFFTGMAQLFLLVMATVLYINYWDTDLITTGSKRLEFALVGVDILKHYPLGIGLGHWHILAKQLHAHNDILQMIVEMGVIAGVIFAGYIVTSFYKTDLVGRMVIAAITTASVVSFTWFIPVTGLVMISLLGGINGKDILTTRPA